jgi:Holliday junction resolvase RusA-like endonuclease
MEYEFTLPIKPFSVNAYFYASRKVKTQAARSWEEEMKFLLEEHKQLAGFLPQHIKNGGDFIVYMTFVYPRNLFRNKLGDISSKTMDLSNVEKPVLDMLFRETLGIDDKHVTQLISRKVAGDDYAIMIRLRLEQGSR